MNSYWISNSMGSALEVTSKVCFGHVGNHWCTPKGTHEYEGYQFPDDKDKVLERIDQGLAFGRYSKGCIYLLCRNKQRSL